MSVRARRKKPKVVQLTFDLLLWGGRRPGAGRKKRKGSGVPHRARPEFRTRSVLHITLKLRGGLGSLRDLWTYYVLRLAMARASEREGFRLVHYSVLSNHMHLVVEADDRQSLSRGMQGLKIRLAKVLNKRWGRTGAVWADRYHEQLLETPRQVRHALCYVLNNARHHGLGVDPKLPDYFTSGDCFDGWLDEPAEEPEVAALGIVARPRTWLLRRGWKRHGLIGLAELPRGR